MDASWPPVKNAVPNYMGAVTSYNSKHLMGQGLKPVFSQVLFRSTRIATKPVPDDCWQDAIKAQVLLFQHFK